MEKKGNKSSLRYKQQVSQRAGIIQPAFLFFQDNHYLREYFKHYFE